MDSDAVWSSVLREISICKGFNAFRTEGREGFMVEEKPAAEDAEFDDEYLPACCRNGKVHRHPV